MDVGVDGHAEIAVGDLQDRHSLCPSESLDGPDGDPITPLEMKHFCELPAHGQAG